MLKQSVLALGVLLLAGAAQPTAQQPAAANGGPRAGGPVPSNRRSRQRAAQDRRLLSALLGRARGLDAARDSALRYRVPVLDRPLGRPRLERYRSRPRPGRPGPCRHVPAHRPASDAGAGRTRRSARAARIRSSASRSRTRSPSRCCGASPLRPRSNGRVAGGRHRVPAARHPRRGRGAAARQLSRGAHPQRGLPAEHQGLPQEHRDRRHAHVRRTRRAAAAAAAAVDRRRGRRRLRRRKRPATFGRGGGMFSGTVASVTPTPDSVTLREHVSFVELPDGNYKPRIDDPRAGYGGITLRRLQRSRSASRSSCATSAGTGW